MYPSELIKKAIQSIQKPAWVKHIDIAPMLDADGEEALEVRVIVKPGERNVFRNGPALTRVQSAIREALQAANVELWPYVSFVSADEVAAA